MIYLDFFMHNKCLFQSEYVPQLVRIVSQKKNRNSLAYVIVNVNMADIAAYIS